ncbi:hypothetical protein TPR58_00165 [Sphingomonas sp. HF-S3]|uniref:NfeD-like C-terminal domain-containing protein n=1 Tax=Sphingomonas rustica TaxID=3103142 RepID=A0ABV0B377_9SPHN
MLKSKPVIILLAIVGAVVGAYVGVNILTSGLAQVAAIALFGFIGYLIYNGLRRNRSVEKLSDAERARVLGDTPATGGRVIVYREGFVAKLSGFDILIDGVPHAQLKSPQSVVVPVVPGEHQLVAKVAGKGQPPFGFTVGNAETVVIRIGMGIAGCEISRDDNPRIKSKLGTIPMVRADTAATEPSGIGTAA